MENEFLLFCQKKLLAGEFWGEAYHLEMFSHKLQEGIPLEYINNEAYFYNNRFYVDENVLIPRSETEILVGESVSFLRKFNKKEALNICEVGVGSGALGLSLLMEVEKPIVFWGTDIDEGSLAVCKKNFSYHQNLLNPGHEFHLLQADRLEHPSIPCLDFIVSNPPYIKQSQRGGVHRQVQKFEPEIALFLDDEEFENWYREFFKQTVNLLNKSGALFMEGHEENWKELTEIAASEGLHLKKIINDYTKRPRFAQFCL